MYSSSNSINPFPQLPPALHLSPAPSFLSLDNGCDINFLPQQHSDLLLSEFLYTDYPLIETTEVSNKAKPTNQETSDHEKVNGNGHYIINPQNLLPRKKDRHSKIYTARGPRDRRVRLSIDISRKFFDLQDMLGFDKASMTLDWLLTNSKAAIKELMLAKNRSNGGEKSFSSTNSECEIVSVSGTNNEGDHIGGLMEIVSKSEMPLTSLSEERKKKQPHKIAFHGIAKESRAKARARARERTREKMCTKRVNGFEEVPPDSSPAHVVNQSASVSQIEAFDQTQRMVDSHNHNKSTASSIMKNLAKDVISCPSIPQNWDIVDHTPQLILCYDRHEYLRPANLGEVCNNHSRP